MTGENKNTGIILCWVYSIFEWNVGIEVVTIEKRGTSDGGRMDVQVT